MAHMFCNFSCFPDFPYFSVFHCFVVSSAFRGNIVTFLHFHDVASLCIIFVIPIIVMIVMLFLSLS